ncbi:Cof-type HAD-IIB family hydrolase [Granulicatella seriolae]|uniref:Cof-type HAD-IIB family hydrolase n=1 Tax=Granulicatella seriolae TaxID=2967226 RepID=A0ABT1WQL6_9LACT|nr:Cof-type HAD-IIB family hydrolase [Granulicatella seriolae]
MSKRVIVMDVDGTLATSQKEISPRTKNALIKAQEQGDLIILASGRPTSGLLDFAKDLLMDSYQGLLVSYNGSKVVNAKTHEVLFDQTLSIEQAKAVLQHLKKFRLIPMVDKDDYLYVHDVFQGYIDFQGQPFNVIEYESRGGKFKLCEQDDLAEFVDFPMNKIIVAGDPDYLQENYQAMMAPFKDSLNCVFTGPFYFEFTAKGIDKAKALDTVLRPLGYNSQDVIAFGDRHNDMTMLDYAGIGVAMGNAVPEVKAMANHTTASNDEDGIAKFLDNL